VSDATGAPTTPELGPPLIVADDVHIEYRVVTSQPSDLRARGRTWWQRPPTGNVRVIHAVRGASFVIHAGEAVGLVGRNGSGKSTLLRGIAGLQPLSQGRVWAKGSPTLLGVHSVLMKNMSGSRNIVIGGLALGMSPSEVRAMYPKVVELSGIGESIDLPMKTYSSGMGARLRFAIATMVEPDILLIDEALATGDRQFRRKSQQRIEELRESAGAVVLVSHSLGEVSRSCSRTIWLDNGQIRMDGPTDEVLAAYEASV
jgi:teichoic acid transport system ATP-binding protein